MIQLVMSISANSLNQGLVYGILMASFKHQRINSRRDLKLKEFIKCLDLCESFFNEYILPFMQQHYPDLKFSAGLMTAGSQILGYDDTVSTDHGWGAGSMLFLSDDEFHLSDKLAEAFEKNLPSEYK